MKPRALVLPLLVPLALSALAAACTQAETSCFPAGTRVDTPDGARPIEALRVGDAVLAFDLAAGAVVPRRVLAVHRAQVRELRYVRLEGEAEERLAASPSHPFWSATAGSWKPLAELRVGEVVRVRSRADATSLRDAVVASIRAEERHAPSFEVWNLTVETPESNYFAAGVLVHNKSDFREPEACASGDGVLTIAGPTVVDTGSASPADVLRYRVTSPARFGLAVRPPPGQPAGVVAPTLVQDADLRAWTVDVDARLANASADLALVADLWDDVSAGAPAGCRHEEVLRVRLPLGDGGADAEGFALGDAGDAGDAADAAP